MSQLEKAKERIRLRPKNYTYTEARQLLSQMGFVEFNERKREGHACMSGERRIGS